MSRDQLEQLQLRQPFQPFEMLLADQRSVRVENLDFWALSSDGRTVIVYELPDKAEAIDAGLIVSLKFREPELMMEAAPADA